MVHKSNSDRITKEYLYLRVFICSLFYTQILNKSRNQAPSACVRLQVLPRFLMVLFSFGKSGAELQQSLGIPESIKVGVEYDLFMCLIP